MSASPDQSPKRKRKSRAPADYSEEPVKFGKCSRDIVVSQERFELLLDRPYGPRLNSDGARKSGKDKRGHTLYWDDGVVRCQACNNKRIVFGAIVQHIIGEGHCRKVAQIYRNKEDVRYSQIAQVEESDEDEAEIYRIKESGTDSQIARADELDTDEGDGEAQAQTAKPKLPKKKKKKKARGVGNGQNALTVEGGLVVNGLDVMKYIRGLEARISELERKLAAATNENATVA